MLLVEAEWHILKMCAGEFSLHAWGQMTTAGGQGLLGPAVWLQMAVLYVPALYPVHMAFQRQLLLEMRCWRKCFFILIQVQASCLKTVSSLFLFSSNGTEMLELLPQCQRVHFLSFPLFFSHCMCKMSENSQGILQILFKAFVLEWCCK